MTLKFNEKLSITPVEGGGSQPVIESLTVTPTTSAQTITAPSGVDGYSPVDVDAVTSAIDSNIVAGNIKDGVTILGVTGNYSGGSSGGKYKLLDRVKDDSNNEIGTVSGFFTDGNNVEYAVVCLDARYRFARLKNLSNSSQVTGLPYYSDDYNNFWPNAKETATVNTQKTLDYCAEMGYTSEACSACRGVSFVIDNTTYYGQLPNMLEIFNTVVLSSEIASRDPDQGPYYDTDFSTNRNWMSSTQSTTSNIFYLRSNGSVFHQGSKGTAMTVCTVLEIPNQ